MARMVPNGAFLRSYRQLLMNGVFPFLRPGPPVQPDIVQVVRFVQVFRVVQSNHFCPILPHVLEDQLQ